MSHRPIRTAIFPVAGMGTRFLPATKAVPKELLPVLDTPLIQFAIDEAVLAGIERLIFVSHPSKPAIQQHVRDDADLRATLRARGKDCMSNRLAEDAIDTDDHDLRFVMQDEPLGLGHAIACARGDVLPGPVAVLLPDDLILGEPGCLSQMIDAYADCRAGHMVATMDVARDEVSSYGILRVASRDGRFAHADGIVEKPEPADAPSTTAVVGRYVLDPAIFDALAHQTPGAGGEIQLTDAIARGIADIGLAGFRFAGTRFDCGSKRGMLAAQLYNAAQDPQFDGVIADFLATLRPAGAA